MRPSGTIYQKGKSYQWHGEILVSLPKKTRAIYGFFQGIGAGLIGFSLIAFIFLIFPVVKEEIRYEVFTKNSNITYDIKAASESNSQEISVFDEANDLGLDSNFSIYIPKIDARSKIISDVDPLSKSKYLEALTRGVAHSKTTSYPGQGKPIFLFSHSTDSPANFIRYNAVFYLLKKLDIGDQIVIYHTDKKHVYTVENTVSVSATDTSWLSGEGNEEKLFLMTCDPPGTTIRRFIVIAKKKS